jgi:hypothetical protein
MLSSAETVPFEKDGEPEIELLAEILIAFILDPKQSLQVRRYAPRIGDFPPPSGTGPRIFTDQHGLAKSES